MNQVQIIGRLTKDVELRYTAQTQKAIAMFTVAVYMNKDITHFIRCKAWDKTAEILAQRCGKGSKIGLVGRIESGSYQKDGKTIYTQEVVAERIEQLDGNKEPEREPENIQETFQALEEAVPF